MRRETRARIVGGIVVMIVAALMAWPYVYRYENTRLSFSANLKEADRQAYLKQWHQVVDHPEDWGKNESNLYSQIGIIRSAMNDHAGAVRAFVMARDRSPEDPRIVRNLAVGYRNLQRYDLAEQIFLDAYRLAPQSSEYWIELGSLYTDELHALDKARAFYLDALKKTNGDQLLIKAYANFLENTDHNYAEAIKYWQVLSDRDEAHRSSYLAKIQSLEFKKKLQSLPVQPLK